MPADGEVHRYTAGRRLMDGYQIMDHVQKNGETAIVQDMEQSVSGGTKGAYYDVYIDGQLKSTCSTEAEAENVVTRHNKGH